MKMTSIFLLVALPALAHADQSCENVSLVERHCICEQNAANLFVPYLETLNSAGVLTKNSIQYYNLNSLQECQAALNESPFCK